MEIKNNEGEIVEVHLKEKWYVSIKRTPVAWSLLALMLMVAPLVLIVACIAEAYSAGWDTSNEAIVIMSVISILFFFIVNIPIIIRILNPAEFVAKTNNGTLSITRNGKEKLSITASNTKEIVVNRYRKKIIGVGIYEEEPTFISKRKGYPFNMAFIPNEERQEFLIFLVNFYGEQRFKELTSGINR